MQKTTVKHGCSSYSPDKSKSQQKQRKSCIECHSPNDMRAQCLKMSRWILAISYYTYTSPSRQNTGFNDIHGVPEKEPQHFSLTFMQWLKIST